MSLFGRLFSYWGFYRMSEGEVRLTPISVGVKPTGLKQTVDVTYQIRNFTQGRLYLMYAQSPEGPFNEIPVNSGPIRTPMNPVPVTGQSTGVMLEFTPVEPGNYWIFAKIVDDNYPMDNIYASNIIRRMVRRAQNGVVD